MKLSFWLKASLALSLLLTTVIFTSLMVMKRAQDKVHDQLLQVSEIEHNIDELSNKLWLLQQYRDIASLSQTEMVHEQLEQRLNSNNFNVNQGKLIVANLLRMNSSLGILLAIDKDKFATQLDIGITSSTGMLAARYNMTIQSMNEDLAKLQKMTLKSAKESQRSVLYFILYILGSSSLLMSAITFITLSAFRVNLKVLTEGIEALAKGDLGSQIEVNSANELSQLAEHFNQMKRSLAVTTIDKKQLQVEVDRQTHELQSQREAFHYQANHDCLTKVHNRSAFEELMASALARGLRTSHKAALLFIDLDRFKEINDNFGHNAGDLVLKTVALHLSDNIRASDILARIGGDEFVIWLEDIESRAQVIQIIEKLISNINKPIVFEGSTISVGVSIGVSQFPDDATSLNGLLTIADNSMYKAKKHPDHSFFFASQEISKTPYQTVMKKSDNQDIH